MMFFLMLAVLIVYFPQICWFVLEKKWKLDNAGCEPEEDDTKKIEDESVAAALMLQMLFWS